MIEENSKKTDESLTEEPEPLQTGWSNILSLLDQILLHLPFAKVKSLSRRYGMLRVEFEGVDNLGQQIILQSVAWKLERLSASTCEHCGEKGFGRKHLKHRRVLCHNCYAFRASDEYDADFPPPEKKKERLNVLDL